MGSKPTMAQVQDFVAVFRERALENLKEAGHLVPCAGIFGTVNPETGASEFGVTFVPCIGTYGDPEVRSMYAGVVRSLAERAGAYAVVFVMEVHIATRVRPENVSHTEFLKQVGNVVASQDPDHVDYVMVQLEHHDLLGPALWLAREVQDADGKTTGAGEYEQWSTGEANDGTEGFSGRFIGLLPPRTDGASA